MIRFIYDGSFEGFLCAASAALRETGAGADSDGITLSAVESGDGDLFSEVRRIAADAGEAARMARRIREASGQDELDSLLFTHASWRPEVPRLLFHYVARTLKEGRVLRGDAADPLILMMCRIQNQVSREINKLMGFLRFVRVAERIYYAALSPDNNVVGFLGPHFADRFPDMSFLIHDIRRGLAFRHDPSGDGSMILLPNLPPDLASSLAGESERLIPAMWKEYFRRIAIQERKNPRLQAAFMPRRYWKHMTEVEDRVTGAGAPGVDGTQDAGPRAPSFPAPDVQPPSGQLQ